jgi:hypothetical protein
MSRTNPYTLPQVILAPVLDEIQANDSNLEPPMVRIRAPNSAILSLDSSADAIGSSSNFIVGGGDQPPIATRRIKRIAMTSLSAALNTPNVNARNNTLVFRCSTTAFAIDHVATIHTGYYYDVPTAINGLLLALNFCTPAAGLAFSTIAYDPTSLASDPYRRRLQTPVGTSFTFGPNSGMALYGKYLFGIPFLTPIGAPITWTAQYAAQASNNLPIGQILLQSTRWIDITSTTLTSYTKNPSFGNNLGNESIIARLFLPLPDGNPILSYIVSYPVWTNFERGKTAW